MHESGYFPHLPLNLFISTRAQNFWKKDVNGWLLVLTGWDPPTAGHCISLLLLVGTDGSLYILSSHIFCTIYCLTVSAGIFIVFTFLKHLYSKSWRFFFFIFDHPIVNSNFSPSYLFLYIVLIQRYTTFQESSSTLGKEKKNNPSGFSPKQSTVFLSCLLLFAGG